VAAARAIGALKGELLDGESPGRLRSITLSGPVVCPECGYDLRPVRAAELDLYLAQAAASEDQPRTSSRPGRDAPP